MDITTSRIFFEPPNRGFLMDETPSRKGFITNYPSFQHWKNLSAGEMAIERQPINLYVHIPFCIQRCSYCYFRTYNLTGNERTERFNQYVKALCREMEIVSQYFHLKERPVSSIFFGGGTPTLLEEDHLHQIVESLHRHFKIDNPEFTVEAEPVTLTQRKANILKDLKVNRISLGIQSLCDDIIKQSKRLDTESKILKSIEIAKTTGSIINIDLLTGLAGETPETWAYTVNRALETEVESITVCKMELYANTDYYKEIRAQNLDLPSEEQELQFMQYALDRFEQTPYRPWCFFTFTKEGRYVHQYTVNIWTGGDLYPLGVSAFGKLGNWSFQNTNDIDKYMAMIETGELPITRGYYLTSLDQMIRDVMLEMKLARLDLKAFQRKHGLKLPSVCASVIQQLESENFITVSDDDIKMTTKGILYGDYVGKKLAKSLMTLYGPKI